MKQFTSLYLFWTTICHILKFTCLWMKKIIWKILNLCVRSRIVYKNMNFRWAAFQVDCLIFTNVNPLRYNNTEIWFCMTAKRTETTKLKHLAGIRCIEETDYTCLWPLFYLCIYQIHVSMINIIRAALLNIAHVFCY